MPAITDTTGETITQVQLSLTEGAPSGVLVIRVPCAAGQYLAASEDSRAAVLARRTGSGSSFVDIASTPISLTPDAGATVEFDVKVQAGSVAGLERVALPVRVTYNP